MHDKLKEVLSRAGIEHRVFFTVLSPYDIDRLNAEIELLEKEPDFDGEDDGYAQGKEDGYDEGYDDGLEAAGKQRQKDLVESSPGMKYYRRDGNELTPVTPDDFRRGELPALISAGVVIGITPQNPH